GASARSGRSVSYASWCFRCSFVATSGSRLQSQRHGTSGGYGCTRSTGIDIAAAGSEAMMEGQVSFSRPLRSASEQLAGAAAPSHPQPFQPLPPPTGKPPFRLELEAVIGAPAVDAIEKAGVLTFHAVGDTGGVKSPESQVIVAMWMERDFGGQTPPTF